MTDLSSEPHLIELQSLLARVSRALDGVLREETAGLELTPAQADAVRFAGTIRSDVATVGQLARVLGVRHTTVLGILRPLVDRGLIERQPHPYSARQQVLALTSSGRALLERLDASESKIGDALAALPREELAALATGLTGMASVLVRNELLVSPAPCRGCRYFDPDEDDGADAPHYCRLIRRYLTDAATQMPCPEHRRSEA